LDGSLESPATRPSGTGIAAYGATPDAAAGVDRVHATGQRPDADLRELSRIIATDSGLSSDLLRHVNSAAVGARTNSRTWSRLKKRNSVGITLKLLGK